MILQGNCLDLLKRIPDESIDLIVCDPPYGITAHAWDKPISMWLLFLQFRRLIKKNGTILVFGVEPLSSKIRLSAEDLYKYDWIWNKSRKHGYHHCECQPLQETENISVFSYAAVNGKNKVIFNPDRTLERRRECIGRQWKERMRYQTNILKFDNVLLTELFHSSQKPLDLLEYLIERHSNPNAVVLDPCCGSGSTLVAARNTGRKYIGMEILPQFVEVTNKRLSVDVLTKRCWKKKSKEYV